MLIWARSMMLLQVWLTCWPLLHFPGCCSTKLSCRARLQVQQCGQDGPTGLLCKGIIDRKSCSNPAHDTQAHASAAFDACCRNGAWLHLLNISAARQLSEQAMPVSASCILYYNMLFPSSSRYYEKECIWYSDSTCESKLHQGVLGILCRVCSLLAGGFILHLQSLEACVQPLQHVSLAGQPTCMNK